MKMSNMLRAYLLTALWAETDNEREDGGDPLEDSCTIDDFAPEALEAARREVAAFEAAHEDAWTAEGAPVARDLGDDTLSIAGHDLWLTRNGHGAGFWDGDWPEPWGDVLTEAAKRMGERNVYAGDDGRLYFSP